MQALQRRRVHGLQLQGNVPSLLWIGAEVTDEYRRCINCRIEQPISEFAGRLPGRVVLNCRTCREQRKEYNARHRHPHKFKFPVSSCSAKCPYHAKCKATLWQVTETAEGVRYAPLPCFREHPKFDPSKWSWAKMKQLELVA